MLAPLALADIETTCVPQPVVVVLFGMKGCTPCEILKARLETERPPFTAPFYYCQLRPYQVHKMKESGSLPGVPCALILKYGDVVDQIDGGPLSEEDGFYEQWVTRMTTALAN
jgi:hypothetical protein